MYVSCSTIVFLVFKGTYGTPSFGFSHNEYPRVRDAIMKIKELGFRAFDLVRGEGVSAQELAGAISESGMKISSLSGGISKPLNDPDPASFEQYKKEYAERLKLAEAVSCPNITLQAGRPLEGYSLAELFDTALKHLAELSSLSKESAVTVSLEAHQGSILENPKDALRFFEESWPSFGLTYDPSHFTMQDIPLRETEPLLQYTRHVHVRNASLGKMQDTMENGTVDFRWLIPALKDHGYDGAVAIEYFGGLDEHFANIMALKQLLVELGVEA